MAIDLLSYTQLQDYFKIPDNLNLARSTRAKIFLQRCPNTNFFCSRFEIPEMTIQSVEIPTSSIKTLNEPGEQFTIAPVTFTLLLDEEYESYLELVRWFQFVVRNGVVPESFSNALVCLYSSEMKPLLSIKFWNCYPINVDRLEFNSSENNPMELEITMAFIDLEIEKIETGERLFQDFSDDDLAPTGESWSS